MPMDLKVGEVVRLRKPHPCGGFEWEIVRIGADIGLRCLKCKHRVLVPRSRIEKRIKKVLSAEEAAAARGEGS
ncbi:MAG: DUF951 domain-containing protein [Anaerolineae bacterium]|jgi:hypothetical protein